MLIKLSKPALRWVFFILLFSGVAAAGVPEDERRRQIEIGEFLGRTRLLELLERRGMLSAEEARLLPALRAFVDKECPAYFRDHLDVSLKASLNRLVTDPSRLAELATARRITLQTVIPSPAEWAKMVEDNPSPPPKGRAAMRPLETGTWMMVVWGAWSQTGEGRAWEIASPNRSDAERVALQGLAETFDRSALNSEQVAELAAAGGCDGVVIVTRHLDGVPLFSSGSERDAAANDALAKLVNAVRGRGLKVGLYYCLLSFRHPDSKWSHYHPDYVPGYSEAYPERWRRFEEECLGDLEWLVSRYQPNMLWTDERWLTRDSERLWSWLKEVKARYPWLQVGDRGTREYADFLTPDAAASSYSSNASWLGVAAVSNGPGFWHRAQPTKGFKSSYDCIKLLAECRALGGRLILSIGPDGQGRIAVEEQAVFHDLGAWLNGPGRLLKENYVPAPAEQQPTWGRIFHRGNTAVVYVFGEALPDKAGELTFRSPVPVKVLTIKTGLDPTKKSVGFNYDALSGICKISAAAITGGKNYSALLINAPLD